MNAKDRISKAYEQMNEAADTLRALADDLEDAADGLLYIQTEEMEQTEPLDGFAAVHELLHSGKRPALGQMIHAALQDGRVAKWRIIDTESMAALPDSGVRPVVAQLAEILDYRPFSRPDKAHPWGWNDYSASELAAWLDDEFAKQLAEDDFHCIVSRGDLGTRHRKIWLLSAEEAGFESLSRAFGWYASGIEEERCKRRELVDSDGDAACWWLRTPYSGGAYYVRLVFSDGTLYNYFAMHACGVAPACIIG